MIRKNDAAEIRAQINSIRDILATAVKDVGATLSRDISEIAQDTERQRRELADLIGTAIDGLQHDNRELRDALRSVQSDISAARRELQQVRTEIETVRLEAAQPQTTPDPPAASGSPPEPSATRSEQQQGGDEEEFNTLLDLAAGIAYAKISCHRDTWDFLVAEAARGEHFRLPAIVNPDDDYLIDVDISGRTLIAMLEALQRTQGNRQLGAGTRHIASKAYRRIKHALQQLAPDGTPATQPTGDRAPVTRIVIDDRIAVTGTMDSRPATD
ncbi:hypothetical protein [Streptomyces sp. 4R-3d]|uniref:hypothetical protein n=1 Tax=Streptomyces sp. 4R-3d TaxID=2559605 RepID=UPI001071BAC0|nr:hypothetical protein [Streptomyces sp. 4R-3d]TFI30122.1 hypothetical protein E4P36_05070 [Streptomyces sp. 4R-3d]